MTDRVGCDQHGFDEPVRFTLNDQSYWKANGRAIEGVDWKTIQIELGQNCKEKSWFPIGTANGVRDRAIMYAKRHGLPEPAPRQER